MYHLEVKIRNHGSFTMKLDESIAPVAVNGVISMVQKQGYDNHIIERLEPGFVIQPVLFDVGIFANSIEPEFLRQNIPFERGVVAMAGDVNVASEAQFFITLTRQPRLDSHFTVIGEITSGWDEIERLEQVEVKACKDPDSDFIYHCPVQDEFIEYIKIQ